MSQGETSRLQAALAAVLARDPAEREEAIEDVCRDDLALARQVRRHLAEELEVTQATEASVRALGPYLLLEQIGEGGMGTVYRARDARLRREVAVKVLSPAVAAQPDLVARFEREARAVAALSHPNVVVIHDVGYEADTHFIVMELLDGHSLGEVAARGRLPAPLAIRYIVQVCNGLAAAHAKGIVHRDLKPGNIIITGDGRAVLVDFGIAKTVTDDAGDQSTFVTTVGSVMGTPQYMSPEQVRGLRVDHRSDIFSLGIVLFELLTGESAFDRPTLADCLSAVLTEDPLERWDEETHPTELQRVVRRCLDKDPEQRFQSAAALESAVGRFTDDAGHGSGTDLGTETDATTIAPSALERDLRLVVGQSSALGPRLAGGAAIAAVFLVGAGIWLGRGEAPAEAPPPSPPPAIEGNSPTPPAGGGAPAGVEPAEESPPAPPPIEESPGEDRGRRDAVVAARGPAAVAPTAAAGGDRADARPRIDVAARAEHRRSAYDAFAGGDHRESLRLVEVGLQLYDGDPELQRLLNDLENTARDRARVARGTATAEAVSRASSHYAGADARFEAGRLSADNGRAAPAIRAFWDSEEMFEAAILAADVETARADAAGDSSGTREAGSGSRTDPGGAGGGSDEADAAGIRTALDEYRRAYESRSSAAVRRVDPGLTTDELRALDREFLDWTDYRRELRVLRTSVGGGRAEVVVAITDHITPRAGAARQVGRQAIFSLERSNGLWTITNVRYVG